MEGKLKHLEMIQAIINRLANNSFLLKGWTVLLVSTLSALGAKDANVQFVLLAYVPAIAFWLLDGYFLWQERLYRCLYDSVRVLDNSDIDFWMDISRFKMPDNTWLNAVFSRTILGFHGTVIGSIIIVMMILKHGI